MRIGIRDIRRCASTTYTHTDIGFSTPARYILLGLYYYAKTSVSTAKRIQCVPSNATPTLYDPGNVNLNLNASQNSERERARD